MIDTIVYGDIFRINEIDYIFLASTEDDTVYAAKILDTEKSIQVDNFCTRSACSPNSEKIARNILCCYVKLTTEGLNNKLAHLAEAQNALDIVTYCTTGIKINNDDRKVLKKEIIDPDTPLPKQLKDLINEIEL